MRNILLGSYRPVLEQFVWANVLVALDFDGTLAPIVSSPARAFVRPSTARLARQIATSFPCAIISSRRPDDLKTRIDNLGNWSVWTGGSAPSARLTQQVLQWEEVLSAALEPFGGVEIENKITRLTIHFRRSREKRAVIAATQQLVRRFTGARLIRGLQVLHI
jgi:trehalose-phosphatase